MGAKPSPRAQRPLGRGRLAHGREQWRVRLLSEMRWTAMATAAPLGLDRAELRVFEIILPARCVRASR